MRWCISPRCRAAAVLGGVLLVFGCTDENAVEPVGPPPEASAYYTPNTGLECADNCLTDDVVEAWGYTVNNPIGKYVVVTSSSTPTTRGGTMEVTWCEYRTSDDYLYGCYGASGWWKKGPDTMERIVSMGALNSNGDLRVQFNSKAHAPEIQVLEYERPSPVVCDSRVCQGPFRLKVRLTGAGWYAKDRITIYGENASGSRWGLEDGYPVVDGETFEWTWPSLYPPTPGSRLIVSYRPWYYSTEGMVEIALPLSDASDSLRLEASHHSVESGTPVTFTATAANATLIEVLSWNWTPDSTAVTTVGFFPTQTSGCAAGVNPCTTAVYETGVMEVQARVDGQIQAATAHVQRFCEETGRCVLRNYFPEDSTTFAAIENRMRDYTDAACDGIADRWHYQWTHPQGGDSLKNVAWYEETVYSSQYQALSVGHAHTSLPWVPIHLFRGNADFPNAPELDLWTSTAVHETLHAMRGPGHGATFTRWYGNAARISTGWITGSIE